MKIFLIGMLSIGGLLMLSQVIMNRSAGNIEMYKYKVIRAYDDFEIRAYEPAVFTYVTMDQGSYEETSRSGFRQLAGYIFGNNEKRQKIAMTSPVAMTLEDSVTMMFMVPSEYQMSDLPKPNDPKVKFREEPEKYVAAVRFGGWASDKKIASNTQRLKALLEANKIEHSGHFSYLGYNPPYEVVNRRNEIVVEVDIRSINQP
ncbi:MAG: heme-binding protein [Bacteroidetes bacterium]|nr:MAG: heme-binding protein [Bacteroidota bacterium]